MDKLQPSNQINHVRIYSKQLEIHKIWDWSEFKADDDAKCKANSVPEKTNIKIKAPTFYIPSKALFWSSSHSQSIIKYKISKMINHRLFKQCIQCPLIHKIFINSQEKYYWSFTIHTLFKSISKMNKDGIISDRQYLMKFIQLLLIIKSKKTIEIEYHSNNNNNNDIEYNTQFLIEHPCSFTQNILHLIKSRPNQHKIMFQDQQKQGKEYIFDILWVMILRLLAELFLTEQGIMKAIGVFDIKVEDILAKPQYPEASKRMLNYNIEQTDILFNKLRTDCSLKMPLIRAIF